MEDIDGNAHACFSLSLYDPHSPEHDPANRVHRSDRSARHAHCRRRSSLRHPECSNATHDDGNRCQRARTAAAGRFPVSARSCGTRRWPIPARRHEREDGEPDGRRAGERSRALSCLAAAAVGLSERDGWPPAAWPLAASVFRRAGWPARARDLGAHLRRVGAMKVKMILPALTEATSPLFRPIKYSLFPPLGLATLAAYLGDEDDVE